MPSKLFPAVLPPSSVVSTFSLMSTHARLPAPFIPRHLLNNVRYAMLWQFSEANVDLGKAQALDFDDQIYDWLPDIKKRAAEMDEHTRKYAILLALRLLIASVFIVSVVSCHHLRIGIVRRIPSLT
jgi:hypothetical protein